MRPQLCPWLAAALLFGALSLGNPFLRCPAPAALGAGEGGQPGGADKAAASVPDEAAPVLDRPSIRTLPVDAAVLHETLGQSSRLAESAPIAQMAVAGAGSGYAVPAMTAPSVSSALRTEAKAWPKCPDPTLEDLVVDFDAAGVEPVWVLRDGRRVTRSGLVRREQ